MIALLLGSFNPIHNGHVSIAQHTIDTNLADEVWFVVSPQNPLKSADTLAPFSSRVEMVRLATRHNDQFRVCTIEQTLQSPWYTINTIKQLNKIYPQYKFIILAGSDIMEQLPMWYQYRELEQLTSFLIYPRGANFANCSPEMSSASIIDITSTECRDGLYPLIDSTKEALAPEVLEYILTNKLYISPKSELYEQGVEYYRSNNFGEALNAFNEALAIDPTYGAAVQMKQMIESILNYRYTEIYNP